MEECALEKYRNHPLRVFQASVFPQPPTTGRSDATDPLLNVIVGLESLRLLGVSSVPQVECRGKQPWHLELGFACRHLSIPSRSEPWKRDLQAVFS